MAQVKRALNRKDKDQDKKLQESTDVPIDTQAFEEKREVRDQCAARDTCQTGLILRLQDSVRMGLQPHSRT